MNRTTKWILTLGTLLVLGVVLTKAVLDYRAGIPTEPIVDEAKALGKTPADFAASDYDYFREMDQVPEVEASGKAVLDAQGNTKLKILELTSEEIKGRNSWIIWTAGNQFFWDWLSNNSYGFMDLLKLVDFAPSDPLKGKRFGPAGLIIEPGTAVPATPDEFGFYIRKVVDPKAAQPDPAIYGVSSGIVGLRLFPNPKFDEKARQKWDVAKYRNDPGYYNDPFLVRPYRVGMSCGFCHVSPHPLNPPKDVEAPQWANLSSNIGAQYLRTRAVFGNLLKEDNFVYHLLDAQPPGTIDTSLIASDNINNPNTMNAVFEVPARLDRSGMLAHRSKEYVEDYLKRYGFNDWEKVSEATAKMPVLLYGLPDPYANPRPVPRILLEGADSVGAWGALARVFLNIGMFGERWVTLHNPLVGFRAQQPFKIADCQRNSVNWQTNEKNVDYLAKFFLKSTAVMRLKDAPGGAAHVKGAGVPWAPELAAGRQVFAQNCIVCHSSKQPNGRDGAPLGPEKVPAEKLVAHMKDPGYRQWALAEVERPEFWQENFLSTEHRVPVTVIKTEAGRSLGSNGIAGHMWEDFSSDTYKALPGVGNITYWNPFTQKNEEFTAPAGGRGYFRPASLVSLWATAPFLHNNSVGLFNNDPSVEGRLAAFDDGIRRLLTQGGTDEAAAANRWLKGPPIDLNRPINGATLARFARDHGLIWRTPVDTYLHIPARSLEGLLKGVLPGPLGWIVLHPWIVPVVLLLVALLVLLRSDNRKFLRWLGYAFVALAVAAGFLANFIAGKAGDLNAGPIPAGTPVNLLANTNPDAGKMPANVARVLELLKQMKKAKTAAEREAANAEIATKLLEISNSPDLVMDRGHYFAKSLTPRELEDLIDLLKTL